MKRSEIKEMIEDLKRAKNGVNEALGNSREQSKRAGFGKAITNIDDVLAKLEPLIEIKLTLKKAQR